MQEVNSGTKNITTDATKIDLINVTNNDKLKETNSINMDGLRMESASNHYPTRKRSRYWQIFQMFKPYRKGKLSGYPIDDTGLISMVYLTWLTSLFKKAIRVPLQLTDLFACSPFDSAELNSKRLQRLWEEEIQRVGQGRASFLRTVFRFIRTRFLFGLTCLAVCFTIGMTNSAFTIRRFVDYASNPNASLNEGVLLCFFLGSTYFISCGLISFGYNVNCRNGVRIRAAIISLVYKKVLRAKTLNGSSIGQIINVCTNDSLRFYEIAIYLGYPLVGPFITVFGIIYLVKVVGPSSLVGSSLFLYFFIYQIGSAKIITELRRQCLRATDRRVRMINELIICIKLIKMYAWEIPFAEVIAEIRNEERRELQKAGFLTSFNATASPLICALASMATFSVHIALGYNLTPTQAFTCIAVTNSMRVLLLQTPRSVRCIADCIIAAQRIKKLLLLPDIQNNVSKPNDYNKSIEIKNGTFAWEITPEEIKETKCTDDKGRTSQENVTIEYKPVKSNDDTPNVLFNIDLDVNKKELFGVCGSVGSGKSSLLSAILGQMETSDGSLAINGSIAYVPQEATILNDTLKENVLFGNKYNKRKYDSAIFNSCLSQDIDLLPSGHETEIGERGINLSGGQKQRVSLARALYAERDIYLLDDPLSAVDVHVGEHIFTKSIKEALQNKSVLFITHQLQYLKQCDKIIMLKEGRITESGTFQNLVEAGNDFSNLIYKYYSEQIGNEENVNKERDVEIKITNADSRTSLTIGLEPTLSVECLSITNEAIDGALTTHEVNESGSVNAETFSAYVKAAGGYLVCFLTMLSFSITIGSATISQWWLSMWLDQGGGGTVITDANVSILSTNVQDNPRLNFYQGVYLLLIAVMILTSVIKSILYVCTTLRASSSLHDSAFRKVFNSPMRFFDTTPSGQIMNRFSKDLDEIDVQLPITMESFFIYVFSVTFALIAVSIVFPYFLLGVSVAFVVILLLGRMFRRCLRDLKRLENISRSPYLSHLTATIQGVQTMRAYSKQAHFNKRFEELVDKNSGALLLFELSNRWIAVRFDILVMFMTVSVGIFTVMSHGTVSPALVGLAITYSIYLLGTFQFSIRLGIESEARFTSTERLVNYINNLEIEGKDTKKRKFNGSKAWPSGGKISFDGVNMRYRENLPLVLKGISFKIDSNEKIGIVGRTGSGKSSLAVTLYRLVETCSGCITIDDVDISTLDLELLRSKLAIIPQDPVLFVGSIRYNLDPFNQFSDDEIWEALEKAHMKNTISSLESQLMARVSESGDNFSLGERQLICMTRALLRKSKILILDEATAAIDTETDNLIQITIRQAFSDCTMLTIAHRLHTVRQCDRVMVLDDGNIVEFDSPSVLLSNPKSAFSRMTANSCDE